MPVGPSTIAALPTPSLGHGRAATCTRGRKRRERQFVPKLTLQSTSTPARLLTLFLSVAQPARLRTGQRPVPPGERGLGAQRAVRDREMRQRQRGAERSLSLSC